MYSLIRKTIISCIIMKPLTAVCSKVCTMQVHCWLLASWWMGMPGTAFHTLGSWKKWVSKMRSDSIRGPSPASQRAVSATSWLTTLIYKLMIYVHSVYCIMKRKERGVEKGSEKGEDKGGGRKGEGGKKEGGRRKGRERKWGTRKRKACQ